MANKVYIASLEELFTTGISRHGRVRRNTRLEVMKKSWADATMAMETGDFVVPRAPMRRG